MTPFQERREALAEQLQTARIEGFFTTALPNIRYLAGFTGSNGALLLTRDRSLLVTDPRYATQAPQESDCEVKIAKGPMLKEVARWIKRLRIRSLGYERNRISLAQFEEIKTQAENIRLKPLIGAVEAQRSIKSESEISAIRTSVVLNSAALAMALRQFKSGMKEMELAAEIDYSMRKLGADGVAFETIVASGARAALPHARPTSHEIKPDQLLLIDMGASVAGYASDMTRTYALGKLDAKRKKMYRAVLESQLAAIDAVRPGVTCASVDRAARTVLSKSGLEELFIHSTGHGLGLEIHEQPRIGRKEKSRLHVGMVITIEPGVYDAGLAGVRIEDTVVVTASGCETLTPTEKELVVL